MLSVAGWIILTRFTTTTEQKIGHEPYFRNASALKLARPATLKQLSNQEITPINYSKWTKFKTEDFLVELQKKVKVYLVSVRKCQMEMDFKCLD